MLLCLDCECCNNVTGAVTYILCCSRLFTGAIITTTAWCASSEMETSPFKQSRSLLSLISSNSTSSVHTIITNACMFLFFSMRLK